MLTFLDVPDGTAHFQNERPPKVLLTTCLKPSKVMYSFLSEMLVSPEV